MKSRSFLLILLVLLAGCRETPVPPSPKAGGIRNAEDFAAFAEAVNAGKPTAPWENEEGWITLLDDIDFNGVSEWIPVGCKDRPFTRKFDGRAHSIQNLKLVDAVTTEGSHFGLFGYLGSGAIVQNFTIDQSCSLTVTSSASHSAGMIAGALYDATVRDVTSYAPLTYSGEATGYVHLALIGSIYADKTGCTIDSVHNRGEIKADNTKNLNSGDTALHVAGIVAFANAAEGCNVISSCNNYGSITSQAGRTAGILAVSKKNTTVTYCENYGDQLNTMPKDGGARLGNICCYATNGSAISHCKNYGKLVSTRSGYAGGIISLPGVGTYEDNENYGEIITDSENRGVLFGYVTLAAAWKGGKASGTVGRYNDGRTLYDYYNEPDKLKYLGNDVSSGQATFTDVEIDIEMTPDPELETSASFRILFIGNSFTKDAVEHLPGIVAAAGLNDIQMVHMYYPGRTVPEFNSKWATATDYDCYVCNPGKSSWRSLSGKTLFRVASLGKWDVVTIQEHTGRKLAWGWTPEEKSAVQGLVDKIKSVQEGESPKFYYVLSQAYHDLDKAENVAKPFSNTDEMWTVISAHAGKAMEECTFDGIISTGAMLQNLRTSSLNNADALTRDGYHMDYGIARYGAACTVFETAIGPYNGNVKLDGNTYRTTGDSQGTTAITDGRAPIALQAARYAISQPYAVTDMSAF